MRNIIGVMGTSAECDKKLCDKAFSIGAEIAKSGCILLTGATSGLPHFAEQGAKSEGGFVLGICPAASKSEHTALYKKPLDATDILICTGAGFLNRDIINIRTSDAVIFINGGVGTLNEFTVAYFDSKIIGILEGSGGVSDSIKKIVPCLYNKKHVVIIYEKDPKKLVQKILKELSKGESHELCGETKEQG